MSSLPDNPIIYESYLPAKPIIQELSIKIFPSCHQTYGDNEKPNGEDEEQTSNDDRTGLGRTLEAATINDRHLDFFFYSLQKTNFSFG